MLLAVTNAVYAVCDSYCSSPRSLPFTVGVFLYIQSHIYQVNLISSAMWLAYHEYESPDIWDLALACHAGN